MSAIVTPVSPGGRRSEAHCPACDDGVRGATSRAEQWAADHNRAHHLDPK